MGIWEIGFQTEGKASAKVLRWECVCVFKDTSKSYTRAVSDGKSYRRAAPRNKKQGARELRAFRPT